MDGGNPLATLNWTCEGINVQGVNANIQSSAISRYTVTLDTSYNGQTCACTASHQLWSGNKVVQSQPFIVHYPPTTNPVVSGYDGTFRYQNDVVTLTCIVSGGSPPATLSWTCNGLQSTVRQSISGTTVTSDIRVTMTKELNEKTCICHGRHSDIRYSPNVLSDRFIVYYPSSIPLVEISTETPFPWIEKGNGKLQCSVNDGNPPVSYEWSSAAGIISDQTSHILSLTSLTKDDNMKGYSCKVSNAYTIAKNLNVISRAKQLDVEYNPVVTVGLSPAYIRETDSFERPCTADSNPTSTITWTSNTSPSNAAILKLDDTVRNQTGDYACKAQAQSKGRHGLLSGQAVLKVIVQFPPTVHAILEQTGIIEGQTVYMYCLARGVPDQYTYGGWVQEYRNTIIRSAHDFMVSQNKQNITLSEVTHQNIGTYRCKVHNTITDKYGVLFQHGMTNLDIKSVFNSSEKFHTELNKTFEIRIPFFLNPLLQNVDTITLTKQNISQKERPDIKMNIGTTKLDIVFYGKAITVEGQEVIIQMIQFKSELQGNYTISIKNFDEGSISYFVFEVMLSDFKILSSTSDSVEVTWLAGNNGGHPQTFVISYHEKGKNKTLKTKNVTETLNKINYTLTISGLTSEREYSFSIYAYNRRGNSKHDLESLNPYLIATAKIDVSEKNGSDYNGMFIGVVIGFIVGVLGEGVVISILFWRKGNCNGINCRPGKTFDKDENQQRTQYEDVKNEIDRNDVYDGINTIRGGVANNQDSLSQHGEYESLGIRHESAAYQQIHYKVSLIRNNFSKCAHMTQYFYYIFITHKL
ncbi:hypothetical protein KUTeg_017312 [Tegillarca granosa]|uniref:Nephrin/kirre n=1 Tax=Tegillarca granosa TaxID=220873 RepID=A0ABQ9EIL6_TEGGR|nr:hypothetical protein KUTeg_017312 [Tegillarca granosa]